MRLIGCGRQGATLEANLEGLGGYGGPHIALETGQRLALGQGDIKAVHERGKEQEELHACQHIAQAHASSHAERDEVFGLAHLALRIDEPCRAKLLGLLPQCGVHVNAVDQWNDVRAGRYGVTIQFHISVRAQEIEEERERELVKCFAFDYLLHCYQCRHASNQCRISRSA